MSINLNERLPANTYIYVGRRTLRHEDEQDVNQEEREEYYPEQYPHTFINFGGATLKAVLEHAGGKQGCVVDTQKVVRAKHTLNEVNAWRDGFTAELAVKVLNDCENVTEGDAFKIVGVDPETDEPYLDEPFVVIDFKTAGSKLSVPVQPKDLLEKMKTEATAVYEAMLANLSEEEQLERVEDVYHQLEALMK